MSTCRGTIQSQSDRSSAAGVRSTDLSVAAWSSRSGDALPRFVYTTTRRPARLNRALGARAFTIGHDIAFGTGEYRPGTAAGDVLIAHELAHTIQQEGREPGSRPRDAA